MNMRNKLDDLKNHLFAQIEAMSDEDIKGEELEAIMKRGQAIVPMASQIIAIENLYVKKRELDVKTMELALRSGFQIKADSLNALISPKDQNEK